MTWGDWHSLWNTNIRFYLNPYKAQFIPIPTDTLWVKKLDNAFLLDIIDDLHPIYYKLFELTSFKENFTQALTDLDGLIENIEQQWQEECRYFGDTCLNEERVQTIKENYAFLTKKETIHLLFNTEKHSNENRFYRQIRSNYDSLDTIFKASEQSLSPMIAEHIHARAYSDGEVHLFNYTPYPVHITKIIVNEPCDGNNPCASHWINPEIQLKPSTSKIEGFVYQLAIHPPDASHVTIQTNVSGTSKEKVIYVENYSTKLAHLTKKDPLAVESYIRCNEKQCSVGPGRYFLESPIILPKGYSLEIVQDTTLLFSPGAYIFIEGGQFKAGGTRDQPIYLGPDKETWGGVYVVGDSSPAFSTLEHTTIAGTRAFQHRLISLSGGVTFIDSLLRIQNSRFNKSVAEDALNVVKSSFHISHTSFENNRSDAIDFDYSTGKITDGLFTNIGGDAIDLSGANVDIKNSSFGVISDKALSVGENSHVDVQFIEIRNAGIGIASKDGSVLTGNDVSIVDSGLGDAFIYNKKSFFDGGRLVLSNSRINLGKVHVQFGSTAVINGQTLSPVYLDVERMYELYPMKKLTTM